MTEGLESSSVGEYCRWLKCQLDMLKICIMRSVE